MSHLDISLQARFFHFMCMDHYDHDGINNLYAMSSRLFPIVNPDRLVWLHQHPYEYSALFYIIPIMYMHVDS